MSEPMQRDDSESPDKNKIVKGFEKSLSLRNQITRLRESPHLFFPALFGWLRGWRYRALFLLTGRRFSAGKLLRVYGSLYVSGPGQVKLGDNCLIISNAIKPVCIRTLAPDAVVELENHSGLNGTSIQCVKHVSIGKGSNIADAYITDTAAHTLSVDRREKGVNEARCRPVRIEDNVWISVQVVVLDGVTIGENSVIGACSLVKQDVPENTFAAGNPLRIIRKINTDV